MQNKVVVLSIGNEILLGKTVNTNAAHMGQQLSQAGYEVVANLVCADTRQAIVNMLDYSYTLASVVVCTGGLGPTVDDITRGAMAEFFAVDLLWNEELWQKIKSYYEAHTGQASPENNKAQAMIPAGFAHRVNEVGTAPALYSVSSEKKIFLMPGVPAEMKNFMQKLVMPEMEKIFPKRDFYLQTVHLYGMPEALIAEKNEDLSLGEGVNLAYLPQGGFVDLRVYGENVQGCKELLAKLEQRFSGKIVGYGDTDILQELHQRLIEQKLTLAVAESCTGGMLMSKLVDYAGSSQYLLGGVVSYANQIKEKILGVDSKLLDKHGAVSQEVAEAMARGVAARFSVDLAVAITGVAGPDGGTQHKPVGLVWFAIYYRGEVHSFSKLIAGERNGVRQRAVNVVAGELLKILKD